MFRATKTRVTWSLGELNSKTKPNLQKVMHNDSLLIAEDIWFFCRLSPKFIPPFNIYKICIDLRLFSKILCVSFLRPLRSKDDQG